MQVSVIILLRHNHEFIKKKRKSFTNFSDSSRSMLLKGNDFEENFLNNGYTHYYFYKEIFLLRDKSE